LPNLSILYPRLFLRLHIFRATSLPRFQSSLIRDLLFFMTTSHFFQFHLDKSHLSAPSHDFILSLLSPFSIPWTRSVLNGRFFHEPLPPPGDIRLRHSLADLPRNRQRQRPGRNVALKLRQTTPAHHLLENECRVYSSWTAGSASAA
jgi:hypothetical protein